MDAELKLGDRFILKEESLGMPAGTVVIACLPRASLGESGMTKTTRVSGFRMVMVRPLIRTVHCMFNNAEGNRPGGWVPLANLERQSRSTEDMARARFHAWMGLPPPPDSSVIEFNIGEYKDPDTQSKWLAWRQCAIEFGIVE